MPDVIPGVGQYYSNNTDGRVVIVQSLNNSTVQWRYARSYGDGRLSTGVVHSTSADSFVSSFTSLVTALPNLSGFGWDYTAHPINIYQSSPGRYRTDLDPRSKVNAAIWSGPTYYVDGSRPNNSGDGLSEATAVQSIAVALNKLNTNASATGGRIMIKNSAGGYDRTRDTNDTANTNTLNNIVPSKPVAFIGYGGKPLVGPFANLTYTQDGLSYIAPRSAVNRVLFLDDKGKYSIEAVQRASVADVNAYGGWIQDGANVRIRHPQGDVISNANAKVFVGAPGFTVGGNNVDVYIENVEYIGGSGGCVTSLAASTRNLVFVDVEGHHPGGVGALARNVFPVDNQTGFLGFWRCVAYGGSADGFNIHGVSGQVYVLLVDCVGFDNGRTGSTSNQGLTVHEGCIVFDLNGRYFGNAGGNVRNIDTSQMASFGTSCNDDRGDTIFGGLVSPVDFKFDNTAKFWGVDILAKNSNSSLDLSSGAVVNLRRALLPNGITGVGTVNYF